MVQRISFLLCLLFAQLAYGQDAALQELQSQVYQNQLKIPREKVFVHSDKSTYLPGETIWMKLYVIDAASHAPTVISKVGYVELLSGSEPVMQAKISLEKGSGEGSFLIPSSIATGNYILRSYTNWMKNGDPSLYFEKTISVINVSRNIKAQQQVRKSYTLQVFPEGGNMVSGLENYFGFQFTDEYNMGISGKGFILSSDGDTVARMETFKFGIGSFNFSPKKGVTYKAVMPTTDGSITSAMLPAAYDQGYVIHLTSQGKAVIIDVKASADAEGKPVYLIGSNSRNIVCAFKQTISQANARFTIDMDKLPAGVNDLILFNELKQPLCERLYFKRPEKGKGVQLKTGQSAYGRREQVVVELDTDSALYAQSHFSASVYRLDSLQMSPEMNLEYYFWMQSELKGTIQEPDYYFETASAETDQALDNLMLTHGWRRFDRNTTLADKMPSFQYLPEPDGVIVSGTLIDKRSNQPASGITAYLSWPAPAAKVVNAVSSSDGRLYFPLKDIYGSNELVVQTNNRVDSFYRVDLDPAFSTHYSGSKIPAFRVSEDLKKVLENQFLNSQVQNAFYAEQALQFRLPDNLDTSAFYGIPDKRYYLDDYTRFPTMEEVIQEYVNEVRLTREQGQPHFQVVNLPYKKRFEKDPLVLIDGVPVFDPAKIIRFDPLKIKRIDVMARTYFWGNVINDGIVSYASYEGNLAGFELDPNAVVVQYEGIQLKREFYAPSYPTPEAKASHLPDRRTVLLWAPELKVNSNGKIRLQFYTSDVPGSYQVVVHGITDAGQWISSKALFSTK